MEIEIKNIIPFIITQNYIQDLYTENNTMLLRKEKRHTITMDWETQHYKDVLSVSARYFVGIDKIILKPKWKGKGTRIANTISRKENKVGGLTLSHFKTYYIATIIKTVILAEGQIHRSMEQNREYRRRTTQTCPTDFWQRCKINSMEER